MAMCMTDYREASTVIVPSIYKYLMIKNMAKKKTV